MGPGEWSVLNDPLPPWYKGGGGGGVRVLNLDCGLDTTNSPVVGGAPGYGFHPLPVPYREWWVTLPIPEAAGVSDNGKVGKRVLSLPTLPVLKVLF